MKRFLLAVVLMTIAVPALFAFQKGKSRHKAQKQVAAAKVLDSNEIHWMDLDEVQIAMRKQPRRVYMDVYTDWCGWCKVMEKKTFSNPKVARYINENFYPVRLNAERRDTIRFMGKMFYFNEQGRANDFAIQLLQGRMSFPTSVVLEPGFQNPQPIPGYLDVGQIEMVLRYINEGHNKTIAFDQWQKEFKPTWN